jgi:antitoxin (DNA-binding transcriptional repressor) of toxin-antitoxin stability system
MTVVDIYAGKTRLSELIDESAAGQWILTSSDGR